MPCLRVDITPQNIQKSGWFKTLNFVESSTWPALQTSIHRFARTRYEYLTSWHTVLCKEVFEDEFLLHFCCGLSFTPLMARRLLENLFLSMWWDLQEARNAWRKLRGKTTHTYPFTHTSNMGAPLPAEEISGCHYQILIPVLSVSITAAELWVLKVIDLSPNLQTNILPALFSWPAAMLSEGQNLVLMDFALVGTERASVGVGMLCLYESLPFSKKYWTPAMFTVYPRRPNQIL